MKEIPAVDVHVFISAAYNHCLLQCSSSSCNFSRLCSSFLCGVNCNSVALQSIFREHTESVALSASNVGNAMQFLYQ